MDNYVGKRLDGRYEIREIVGVGGMAVVYKAYDNIDDRLVSIKVLKDEFLANEEFRRRFKNESKAIAVLSHPNIVKVYDVSFGDKLQYIVMEYVEGITLKEYIEQQKVIAWKDAVHFTEQILRALQHAHDKGIVHRDIKPQNIMLLDDGTIKVTDFGIARFNRTETRTMTANAIGSVHYISPEQARGEYTDDKADIYSVGVVLYEMITGRVPFESDSAVSVALMQVQEDAVPPRKLNASIPAGLEQITLHAMEKSTKNRYQSSAEMILDLEDLIHDPSIRFDYMSADNGYYVDKDPTIFVPKDAFNAGVHDAKTAEEDEEPETKKKKSKPIAEPDVKKSVFAGLGIALAIIAVLGLLYMIFFTNVFKGERIEVPQFVGLDYIEDIQGNSDYDDFRIEVNYVTSTTGQDNEVIKQDPESGSMVKQGARITLEVVTSGAVEDIPEVAGKTFDEAKTILEEKGFKNIVEEMVYDKSAELGKVIKTNPAEGTKVSTAETITVFVSSDTSDEQTVVPVITGMSSAEAKMLLQSSDLKLGDVQEVDSNQPKGYVIEQGIKADTKVAKGTTIDVIISNGTAKGNLRFRLPELDSSTESMSIYINHEQVKTANVLCDGAYYSTAVSASGSDVPVEVRINNQSYYTATWDFSGSSPVATSETYKKVTGSNGGIFGGIFQ